MADLSQPFNLSAKGSGLFQTSQSGFLAESITLHMDTFNSPNIKVFSKGE